MASRSASRPSVRVPDTMRAAAIDRFGPPSVLKPHTLPIPRPGPREVLVELHAAGVGSWDDSVRDGSWRAWPRPRFPLIIGTDGAGIVVAKGAKARRFRLGDRVYGYHNANPAGGFYAEYVAVDERHLGRVPRRLDLFHAAAAATTGLTALQGTDDTLRVRPGETVLVFGASGAVGSLAVQFARRKGARVIATASGKTATALVRGLGALVVDARKPDAADRLRSLAPHGLDAALAFAGGDDLERCLEVMRAGGRVAYPNGIEPEPRKRRSLRMQAYDAEAGPREFARLTRAVDEARLRAPIAATYPLARAADAHRRLQRGRVLGRIALRIRRD
jgi:NADPH:quinone reductase